MKKIISCMLLFSLSSVFASQEPQSCAELPYLFKRACIRWHQIWHEGQTDLYLSGYAWHNRYTYSSERVQKFNEHAWGGGLGKGFFTEKGDFMGVYAIGFLDSHRHIEPVVGFAFLKIAHFTTNLKAGLGYSFLVTARNDINNGFPFPGVLPWASIYYKNVSVAATYIPGAVGAGNVLYMLVKLSF